MFGLFDGKLTREKVMKAAEQGDFSKKDLSGLDLSKITFTQCEFKGTNFTGANLSAATFEQCEFSQANLAGANVAGATFEQCDLQATNIASAIGRATFSQCEGVEDNDD